MQKFTLDRSRWYRGKGPGGSALLRASDGKMCCLGLYLESCGVPHGELTWKVYPSGSKDRLPAEGQWLATDDDTRRTYSVPSYDKDSTLPTFASNFIAYTNDDRSIDDEEREKILTKAFAENGVEVTFVDGVAA